VSRPDDDVVHKLTPDRSDQPFDKAILPRLSRCNRLVPDAHGTQSACDHRTVDAITVSDHVARSLIPGECLGYLTRDPIGGWMCRNVDPCKLSASAAQPSRHPPGGSRQRRGRQLLFARRLRPGSPLEAEYGPSLLHGCYLATQLVDDVCGLRHHSCIVRSQHTAPQVHRVFQSDAHMSAQ
jgi:hypothetical protein